MTSIYNNFNIGNGFSLPQINFRSSAPAIYRPLIAPAEDGYTSNPLNDNYGTKYEIEAIANSNPRIREIMSEYKIPIKVNEKELEKLKHGHLQNTRVTASKIYSNLPSELKTQVNPVVLQEAAMFHDYGKVLIPDKILNKESELVGEEWKLMQQHSEIGYELLKSKNLNERSLELIKYHHQNKEGSGYPSINDSYMYGLDSEILAVADRFEALCEERSYKSAMSKEDALNIIKQDVEEGRISQEVYEALKKSV